MPECGRPMVYVFREEPDQEFETRLFECRPCNTTTTVHVLPDKETRRGPKQANAEGIERTWHGPAARLLNRSPRLALHPTGGARHGVSAIAGLTAGSESGYFIQLPRSLTKRMSTAAGNRKD